MEKEVKLLAISILIGCIVLSGAIIVKPLIDNKYNRYYITDSDKVFDKLTGKYYYVNIINGKVFRYYEIDAINKKVN